MKRFLILSAIAALIALPLHAAKEDAVRTDGAQKAFVEQLQQRDSILIADQLLYGALLQGIPDGSDIELPPLKDTLCAYIDIVRPWSLDTLKIHRGRGTRDIRAAMTLTSFDEGEYLLPDFQVAVHLPDGSTDTLSFAGQDIMVCTIPVDTATFKVHDIKAQKRYPLTIAEVLPWLGIAMLLSLFTYFFVRFIRKRKQQKEEALRHDPPHIIALRKLDEYRGDKYWAPAKQKAFYSGVTDALREYIAARYGIGAMEMTTAELFKALKKSDIPEDLKSELKDLFELSDFVKFAKATADDQRNAAVLPLGIRFVTSTYQKDVKEENNVL